jgi:hypothetical protein
MQDWWAFSSKERGPLPEEKMILLRKAQVPTFFEACNLRLDCCKLTLKSADLPALLARELFLFLVFHRRTPHAKPCHHPSSENAWQ